MDRSIKASQEAYPEWKINKGLFDTNEKRRRFYREGYRKGENETAKRAVDIIQELYVENGWGDWIDAYKFSQKFFEQIVK